MEQTLFRKAVVDARSAGRGGTRLVSSPLPLRMCFWFLGIFTSAVLLFLVLNSYTRKQTVTGWLEPEPGLAEIITVESGLVTSLLVQQGDTVRAGQTLFRLSSDYRFFNGVPLNDLREEALKKQLDSLDQLAEENEKFLSAELRQITLQLEGVSAALVLEQEVLQQEEQSLALHQQAQFRAGELLERGLLAQAAHDEIRLRVVTQSALVERQRRTVHSLQQSQREKTLELESRKSLGHAEGLRTRTSMVELQGKLQELVARSEIDYVSPVAGRVASLQLEEGSVLAGQVLAASVIPVSARLRARLQVPASAIGFIRAGQNINLRYTTYAYQKFGVFPARVDEVPDAPVRSELQTGTGLYEITATLSEQTVHAYGEQVPLRAGLNFSADILLDQRTLAEWLLDPLYSLKGSL